jgi:HEAT repeat protein
MLKTKLWLAQRGINSDSAQNRLKAVQRIRALHDPAAIAVLTEALQDPEPAVRAEVVVALGDIEHCGVVKPLLSALRDHSDAVQELAVQALRKTGDASAVEPLVSVLLRGTAGVQYHAAQALRALGWVPNTMGEQIPYYVACGDFKRVTMFGSAAISALTSVLRGGSYERRVAAANALGELGEAAVMKPLLGALKDPEALVRSAVANSLAQLGDVQAVAGLVTLLKDRERNVRVAALSALGQLGDPQAIKSLLGLVNDREWEVRAVLAEALGRIGDRSALPAVMGLLQDRDQEVRQNAADAIGRVGDESVMDSLVLAMVDEHMGVRQAAARSLALLDPYWERNPKARALIPQLQEALKHRDSGVQYAASGLLRRLTGRTGSELASAPVAESFGQTGDRAFDILQNLLRDSDDEVRLAAVEAIVRIKSSASVPALQALLGDKNRWVKQAADKGLLAIMGRQ